ncbi:hypothetical protein B0H67DRAFT_576191 [Lasiosphaeris hirsuta]|uniref:Uncharacterized protein n=1 Tax=Lasiosphaeris hirsuta TaxID=260670 RepID=A0AA40E2Q3_9PEZI|nr:hypothetical protein B0H67DRAFT_576191 [Lasiosphaeris hirsuta]
MADFKPHVPRAYRFMATGLGASMWFWLMWRAKKDGTIQVFNNNPFRMLLTSTPQVPSSSAGSTLGITEHRNGRRCWTEWGNCTYGIDTSYGELFHGAT